MSYDIMVFEDSGAPKTMPEFMEWYDKQTQWDEGHSYSDISIASPALQAFFADFLKEYTALEDMEEDEEIADDDAKYVRTYSIGRDMIYLGFSYGNAAEISEDIEDLASEHGVGVFLCSGSGEVIFADGSIMDTE
ncbi:MAG: hypothetical protein Q4A52_01365 [Bacillota bacterium]|nr:hypothetical protein [Bacillota bacterium]